MGGFMKNTCWPQCVAPVASGAVDSSTYSRRVQGYVWPSMQPLVLKVATALQTAVSAMARSAAAGKGCSANLQDSAISRSWSNSRTGVTVWNPTADHYTMQRPCHPQARSR
jgi:hypothetical protein